MNTKIMFSILLCTCLLTACSVAPGIESATLVISTGAESQTMMPATAIPTQSATVQGDASLAEPLKITVKPPNVPVGPEQTPSVSPATGWQAYTNAALGMVVDYPTDWSASASGARVTFSSPQGGNILLQVGNNAPSPVGQDCTTLINSYGQVGDICFDKAAVQYIAIFKKTAGKAKTWLTLSTVSQDRPTVFFQMYDTLRPAP